MLRILRLGLLVWMALNALTVLGAEPCTVSQLSAPGNASDFRVLFETICEVKFRADACTQYWQQQLAHLKDPDEKREWVKKLGSCAQGRAGALDEGAAFSPKSCLKGIKNGVVDMVTGIPMMVYEATRAGPDCSRDIEEKKRRLEAFNFFVEPGERLKLEEEKLKSISCDDFKRTLWEHSRVIRAKRKEESKQGKRISIFDRSRSVSTFSTEPEVPGLWSLVGQAMDELKLKSECYSPEALSEMKCEMGTAIASVVLGGVGGASKLASLGRLSQMSGKSPSELEALATRLGKMTHEQRVARAIARGDLTDSERILKANEALGRRLSADEQTALLRADAVGRDAGAGYGSYTSRQIAEKDRVLSRAGFDPLERRILIYEGLAGVRAEGTVASAGRLEVEAARASQVAGIRRGVAADASAQSKWLEAAKAREAELSRKRYDSKTQLQVRSAVQRSEDFILEPNRPFTRPDQVENYSRMENLLGRDQGNYVSAAESYFRAGKPKDAERVLRQSPYGANISTKPGRDNYVRSVLESFDVTFGSSR